MKKKVTIIGGGFSGSVSAFLLSRLGYDVQLFEKGEKLGGTSKDIKFENKFFFNGPHYFYPNSKWIKELNKYKEFKKQFKTYQLYDLKKEIGYNFHGSFTDIFNEVQVNNFYAHPTTSKRFTSIKKIKGDQTLKNRIESYQKDINQYLKEWLDKKKFIINQLHFNCAELLNFGRICFIKDLKKVKKIKLIDNYANHILGIPNEKIYLNQKFCIPKNGNDFFYKKFQSFLSKKINIVLNSQVKIFKNKKNIELFNKNEQIKSDFIIWAANPVSLIKDLGYGLLDNPVLRVKIFCADISIYSKFSIPDNFYIQVFSSNTNVFRIYVYKIKSVYKITVESFFDKNEDIIAESQINLILSYFNIQIKMKKPILEKKEVRHYLLSENDYKKFMNFENDFKNTNLIGGGWHLFGRENKINHIMKNFS